MNEENMLKKPVHTSLSEQTPMAKYRVAIIGTGRMGGLIEDELTSNQFSSPYGHYPAYEAIVETEVVAVANRGGLEKVGEGDQPGDLCFRSLHPRPL